MRPDPLGRGRPAGPFTRVVLVAVKIVHSAIFAVLASCIGWLVLSGLIGRRDRTVALAAGLVAIETALYVANDRVCPLTPLAEQFGAERGTVSNIFLPDPIAGTLPVWSSALVILAVALHARGHRRSRAA